MSRTKLLATLGIIGALLAALVGGAAYLFWDDLLPLISNATTDAQAQRAATAPPTGVANPAPPTATGSVPTPTTPTPTSAQTIRYKIVPNESRASYEVNELFLDQNNKFNVAVGVTQDISGTINIDRSAPKNSSVGPITINIQKFKSDQQRRDTAIQRLFLESNRYPLAVFVPTKIEGLPDSYKLGDEVKFKMTGDLTVRNITKPVTFDVSVKSDGTALNGVATSKVQMTDFGFGPIEIGGLIKTENEVRIKFTFTAKPE